MWRFAEQTYRVFGIALRTLAVVAALGGGATLAGAQTSALPVYRFFNNNAGGHFFTISESEKATVIANYPWFRYEGVGFYAYPTQVAGTSPIYRFFNNNAGGHFFTISESEKNTVISSYNWFRFEGPGFYAYPSQVSGALPIYRFFNNNAGGHFFTISESEKATVIANYPWFRYEEIGFYAYSPATFALTTSAVGGGTVWASPPGPNYLSGTVVTLTATPNASYTFSGWSGACTGTGSCVVTMDGDNAVTATFNSYTQQCTYSYSAWSACQSNNAQTRTVISSSPAGCVGTPILSQPCTYTQAGTMTWMIGDQCNNGSRIDFKFYDRSNDLVWPNASTVYYMTYNQNVSQSLSCVAGSSVCIGASSGSLYWGVGLAGTSSCTDCCATCDGRTYSYNFGCPGTPTVPPSATATITNYMSGAYSNAQTAFTFDAGVLVAQLAAIGLNCSGNMLVRLKDLKIAHVQDFVTNAVAVVQYNKNLGYGIDKAAITSLFGYYQTQDLAWLTSYTWFNCGASPGILSELAATFVPAVNSAYSNAVAQVNGM